MNSRQWKVTHLFNTKKLSYCVSLFRTNVHNYIVLYDQVFCLFDNQTIMDMVSYMSNIL